MYRHICAAVLLFVVCSPLNALTWADSPVRQPAAPAVQAERTIEVYFSPKGGCTDAIVDRLNSAKLSIDIQAYSFTSAPIAKAVSDAHKRGVKVRVVLDKSQKTARYTSATFLFNAGVPVFIDAKHAIAHNKIILIDGTTILTGSFNFSKAAEERNAENVLILTHYDELMSEYLANFEEHLAHAVAYERPKSTQGEPENR